MKKLSLKKLNLNADDLLQRNQLKTVFGGGYGGGPCDSCSQLCHSNDDGTYDFGICPSSTGGTSCHNYCCEDGQETYWC